MLKSSSTSKALDALKQVIDPELGIDIVNLGLVYELKESGDEVYVQMTLTSPFCPLGSILLMAAESALRAAGFKKVKIDLVFDPPWTPERMSEEAKRKLGWKDESKSRQK